MKLNFYEDLEQMEYIRKFNENKNKNKKQWRNIMIDELNWNCSIERMICYFKWIHFNISISNRREVEVDMEKCKKEYETLHKIKV